MIPETIFMDEAMERYKCDRKAIDRAIDEGVIDAYRTGRRKLIDLKSADAWFFSCKIRPRLAGRVGRRKSNRRGE